jgi:ABC-type oligopeptide transport system substrate-binding subunit
MLWRPLYSLEADNSLTAEPNGMAAGLPEVSDDGLVVTVRLNEGLRWSDGDDLRAEDFVAGAIRSCNPLSLIRPPGYSNLAGCDDMAFADPTTADLTILQAAIGVRAVDALTMEFKLLQPQPSFPAAALTGSFAVPVHMERFAAATPDEPGEWGDDPAELVYNGPYTLASLDEAGATVEPNPEWSGRTKPSLERLNLRFVEDAAGSIAAYRVGEVQAVQLSLLAGPEEINAAKEEFGGEYGQVTGPATRGLHMQLDNATLSNLDVRLALTRAIDRERLNEVVYGGTSVPTTSWIPPPISGVSAGAYDELIGFDAEAARRHLEAAGYPNGEGFPVLTFLVANIPEFTSAAEFLQQQFKEVLNIDTQVERADEDTLFQRVPAGQFELFPLGWVGIYGDPEEWILGLFNTAGQSNWDNCSDPEIDALIERAEFERDDELRRDLYAQAERLIIERVCGVAPFAQLPFRYLLKPELTGFVESISANDFVYPGDGRPEAWGLRAD